MDYWHWWIQGRVVIKICSIWLREKQVVIINLKPIHVVHGKMARGHEKVGRLNPRIKFSSVPQSCPTLCHRKDCSTPGFPAHHQLPKLAQTHVHWVSMPSNHLILCCPLLLLPLIFPNIRVFACPIVSSLQQGAKVLGLQLQHQSFQWIFAIDFL